MIRPNAAPMAEATATAVAARVAKRASTRHRTWVRDRPAQTAPTVPTIKAIHGGAAPSIALSTSAVGRTGNAACSASEAAGRPAGANSRKAARSEERKRRRGTAGRRRPTPTLPTAARSRSTSSRPTSIPPPRLGAPRRTGAPRARSRTLYAGSGQGRGSPPAVVGRVERRRRSPRPALVRQRERLTRREPAVADVGASVVTIRSVMARPDSLRMASWMGMVTVGPTCRT